MQPAGLRTPTHGIRTIPYTPTPRRAGSQGQASPPTPKGVVLRSLASAPTARLLRQHAKALCSVGFCGAAFLVVFCGRVVNLLVLRGRLAVDALGVALQEHVHALPARCAISAGSSPADAPGRCPRGEGRRVAWRAWSWPCPSVPWLARSSRPSRTSIRTAGQRRRVRNSRRQRRVQALDQPPLVAPSIRRLRAVRTQAR